MIVYTIYSLFCSFDQFHSTEYCFLSFLISFCLYRACFTRLISSNLRCNLMFISQWYYDQLVHFKKEIKKYSRILSWSLHGSIPNVSTVHLNGIWHLIWRYISKPALGEHCIKRTLEHSQLLHEEVWPHYAYFKTTPLASSQSSYYFKIMTNNQ